MDCNNDDEVVQKFPLFNVLKDGRIKITQTHSTEDNLPPSDDPVTGVCIKDVKISGYVSARIFIPHGAFITHSCFKFPLILYIHGGGFCMGSAFSVIYTCYVTNLVAAANAVCVSVEYGLFPAHPLPACYEDSWAALLWVAAHGKGNGPDPWINDYADLQRMFVIGDSAGGNIAHTLLSRVGSTGLPEGVKVEGMVLVHPYFAVEEEDDKMWMFMCPTNEGPSDRRVKPALEDLARIGCDRVLVLVAEMCHLKNAGKGYVEDLIKSGWKGSAEIVENKDKSHCFHIINLEDPEALANMQRICSFIHRY